jgi:hypothetical protein
MFNAYPLNFSSLSSVLENKILDVAHGFIFKFDDQSYDPENEFSSIDNLKADEYQKSTNTPKGYYRAVALPEDLQFEIKKELNNPGLLQVNFYVQIMYTNPINPRYSLAPHVDPGRTMGFIYNIIEDTAVTHFHDLLIKDKTRYAFGQAEVSKPIETYYFKPHKWYVMNHSAVHSVTEVTKTRVAVTSNIPMDYFDFCNRFSNILIRD